MRRDHRLRVHAPTDSRHARVGERLGRCEPVRGDVHFASADVAYPLRLKTIFAVESQAGCHGQGGCGHAFGKVASDVLRARDRAIFQLPDRNTLAPLDRLRVRRDRGQNIAGPKPVLRVLLIVDGYIQQGAITSQERGHRAHKPGSQAIGIHGDTNCHPFVGGPSGHQPRQRAVQLVLEHSNLLDMPAYQPAHLGRRARLTAHDQNATQSLLQLLDPLRNRRWRDIEGTSGALEAALPDNSRQQPTTRRSPACLAALNQVQ